MTSKNALQDIRMRLFIESETQSKKVNKDLKIIEKDLDALELLTKHGITLVVPESECLNNERLTIQLYKKHATKEQWEKLLKLFDVK